MPNDNMTKTVVSVEYLDTCRAIQQLIESVLYDDVILAAVWKTYFNKRPTQTKYLIEQFMPFLN